MWLSFIVAIFSTDILTGAAALPRYHNSNNENGGGEKLLVETLNALEKAAMFFERNVDEVNLDSIFGLRAAEGVIYDLIHKRSSRKLNRVGQALLPAIKKVYNSLHKSGGAGFSSLIANGNEYNRGFRLIVNTRWYYQREQRPPDNDMIALTAEMDDLDEEVSDGCMKDMMGTSFSGKRCLVNDNCWKLMSQHGTFGYTLTHQGLFFILADIKGCSQQLEKTRLQNTTFDEQFTRMGTNILHQMKELAKYNFPPSEHDLFLEQSVVCKWLGMQHCLNREYIANVLEWQHSSGCYKDFGGTNSYENSVSTLRNLLMEKTLQDGCQSHTTGLLVAYLAHSLHWILTEENVNKKSRDFMWILREYPEYTLLMLFSVFIIFALLRIWRRRKKR